MYDKEKFVKDYIKEAMHRLELAEYSLEKQRFNTVIRESQTVVELSVKALLFSLGRVVPQTHNLREELKELKNKLGVLLLKYILLFIDYGRNIKNRRTFRS